MQNFNKYVIIKYIRKELGMRKLLKFMCHCEESEARRGNLIKLNEITTQTEFARNDRCSQLFGGGALRAKR